MSLDNLKRDIKQKNIRNLYLFYGPEEYLKKYYIGSIEKQILTEDLKSLNKIVLEGKIDEGKISDNCETLPVFSDRKLVIVKNSGLFKSGKKGKSNEESLSAYLGNVPEHNCLVFYEEEVDKRLKITKAVKKNGLIVEFDYQKPNDLVKWVTKVFKSYNKEIDTMTASRLVDTCEQGMTEILNEINKLTLYMDDKTKVTAADIEKVCTKSVKIRIFDLTDAVSEKNIAKALRLLDEMLILKEPLPRIIYMINRQIRMIMEMKILLDSGKQYRDAASIMGITPFAANIIFKHTKMFNVQKLKDIIKHSLDLDIAVKTGKMNERIAAEMLICEFSK